LSLISIELFNVPMNKKNIVVGLVILLALIGFIKKDLIFQAYFDQVSEQGYSRDDVLTIVINTPETDLSPYGKDLNNTLRTANIYEGLVAFDSHLKVTPSLALSWGNIDPVTWEFKLRKGVMFHDGTLFDATNVIQNFEEAKMEKGNPLSVYINTIQTIESVDPFTIHIQTYAPDPLLLSKLTKLYIHRPDRVGTGSYKIREWIAGEKLSLTAFTDYWGRQPVFKNAEYKVVSNKTQRKIDFENGKTDILVAVPREQALELPQEQLKTSFSLEVNFLMFKTDEGVFAEKRIREAIRTLFDPAKIEAIGNGFVRPATQFVAPGVYGYNPFIPAFSFDESLIEKALFGNRLEKIVLDYLDSYSTLGDYLKKQLREAGFSVKSNPISPQELLDKIRKNQSSLFLIGWQAEDGDAGGFLDAFIHSQGEYNQGRYSNPEVDTLIEAGRQEMDAQKRLSLLQEIMLKIDEDAIGVPLFESSRLYAIKHDIAWEPRLDGLVLAADVR